MKKNVKLLGWGEIAGIVVPGNVSWYSPRCLLKPKTALWKDSDSNAAKCRLLMDIVNAV